MLDRTSELQALARRVDEKSFAKQNPGMFLVLSIDESATTPAPGPRSTVRVDRTGTTPAPDPRTFKVVGIVRREGSPFVDMMSVGRVEGNDLVIAHPTVSKLHAFFSQENEGEWFLADQDSTNGTWIGGVRLRPHEKHPLRGDDMVAFGECHVAVKGARALWRFLELARRTA